MEWLCILTALNIKHTNGAPCQMQAASPKQGWGWCSGSVCAAASSYGAEVTRAASCLCWIHQVPAPSITSRRFWLTRLLNLLCATPAVQNRLNASLLASHGHDQLPGGNKSTFCISPRAEHLVERCWTGVTTCFCSPLAPVRRESNWEPENFPVSQWVHAGFP